MIADFRLQKRVVTLQEIRLEKKIACCFGFAKDQDICYGDFTEIILQ